LFSHSRYRRLKEEKQVPDAQIELFFQGLSVALAPRSVNLLSLLTATTTTDTMYEAKQRDNLLEVSISHFLSFPSSFSHLLFLCFLLFR
jgi:hypothetical protein